MGQKREKLGNDMGQKLGKEMGQKWEKLGKDMGKIAGESGNWGVFLAGVPWIPALFLVEFPDPCPHSQQNSLDL